MHVWLWMCAYISGEPIHLDVLNCSAQLVRFGPIEVPSAGVYLFIYFSGGNATVTA